MSAATQPARSSIVDVARLAGVSVATVSRALRGLPNVSDATRQRVLHAAEELEYIASPLAAALVTGRTRSVGVVASPDGHWFFTEALCGLERGLREWGYDVVLHVLPTDERREQFFGGLPMRRRVDALALVGVRLADEELSALRGLRVPLVAVGEAFAGVHTERIDNEAAGAIAVRHLLDLGHTRIALIGGEMGGDDAAASAPAQRTAGALGALREAGLSPAGLEDGGFRAAEGAAAMTRLLEGGPGGRPTAVFCQSDEMAFGALHALGQAGVRCPDDVSVVGLDDHELAVTMDLTTVGQPVLEQGASAARWLGAALDAVPGAPDPADHVHAARLIVRGTTGPPSS